MTDRVTGKAGRAALMLAFALMVAACGGGADDGGPEAGGADTDEAADSTVGEDAVETTTTQPEVEVPDGPDEEFLALDLEGRIQAFLDDPNSVRGAAVAEAMGETGDARWGPWLLDIFRLGRSTRIDAAATEAFAKLSGIEVVGFRTDDYRNFGNWVYNGEVDPGPGYRDWKLALYGSIDDEFADLLAETPDDLLLSRIQWGGVGRGGIPELNDPLRVPAPEADWMVEDELVLGGVVDGAAVAYPLRILAHHEMANDEIAGRPVSMVYCTLCRSAVLFDRRVDDQILDFQTSGLLIQSNKIMVDTQTDTLWRHQTGVGMVGDFAGVELAQYPVSTTTWAEWVEEHPDTEVLAIPEPIFFDDPERPPIAYSYEPGEAYRFYYEDPDVWFPVLDTPGVFELKEEVIGLSSELRSISGGEGASSADALASEGETEFLAVQLSALLEEGPQVFTVGDASVAVVPGSGGAQLYDVGEFGLADGPLEGELEAGPDQLVLPDGGQAPRVVGEQLFWFAWFGDHPATTWWPAESS